MRAPVYKPHKGPQELFLSTPADLAIYGGGAGGGKSMALLMEAVRHINNPKFGAVFFRRTYPQIMSEGGLWDTAQELYRGLGGVPIQTPDPHFKFPSGATISFRHMQLEKNKYDWQGSQIPLILFDEATHFSWGQVTYLLSRNRSTCGVRPYMRMSCNPDPDSWLREFIDWWIGPDGYPIKERAGKLRYLAIIGNKPQWADTAEELKATFGDDVQPLSVTFIPSLLEDNPTLLEVDPGYRAKLQSLPEHERKALLGGNWDARPEAGNYFKEHWFHFIDTPPAGTTWVRYWDRAATLPSPQNPDPDYTAGALLGRTPQGTYVLKDMIHFRGTPSQVEQAIVNTAQKDGPQVRIGLEQEPGASGKFEAQYLAKALSGYTITINAKRTGKVQSWTPLSSQAEAGNVAVVRGPWNKAFFDEVTALSGVNDRHDDQADAVSGAFSLLLTSDTSRFKALAR